MDQSHCSIYQSSHTHLSFEGLFECNLDTVLEQQTELNSYILCLLPLRLSSVEVVSLFLNCHLIDERDVLF